MEADLVTAWQQLCQELAPAFTARTYVTFLHVVSAWVLCRSRPAVTGLAQLSQFRSICRIFRAGFRVPVALARIPEREPV